MIRRALFVTAVLAALACSKAPSKKGPYVARGNGVTVTADELKARIDEQSPMIRNSFQSLDRKKQFLDNLVRFELLAKEAEREGLANDPDVQFTMKKVMVSKLYQKRFQDQQDPLKVVPEADVRKYYDEHQKDEFYRPARIHAVHLFVKADAAAPDRAQKLSEARKLLAQVLSDEKKEPTALSRIARERSDDANTKGIGGDLGFRSQEEFEKAYGKELASAVFALADNQTSPSVVETAQGFHLVRALGRQAELSRTLDDAKAQIAMKLNAQRKSKEFDDFVKKLRDDAKIQVFDSELEKVAVSTGPGPGRPGGLTVTGPGPQPAPPASAPPAGHPPVPAAAK